MDRIEFHTSIMENGDIELPAQIREQLMQKPNQIIKVTLEAEQQPEKPEKQYSFERVRKLLKGIKGDMSAEILADREDRI